MAHARGYHVQLPPGKDILHNIHYVISIRSVYVYVVCVRLVFTNSLQDLNMFGCLV
jgi:hypothetical protein